MANEQEIDIDDIQGHENNQTPPQKEPQKDDDIKKICQLCERLVSTYSDGNPGIPEEQLENLKSEKRLLRDLVTYHCSGDQIGVIPSKKRRENIERSDLKNSLSLTETQILHYLATALVATFEYINSIDLSTIQEKTNNGEMLGDLNKSVNTNRKFANFFIQADKILHCGEVGLMSLYKEIIDHPNFNREFSTVCLSRVPSGIFAMVAAYLEIPKIMPGGSLEISSLEQDRDCAVDLIWTKDGEIRVFEVKGSQKVNENRIFNLQNQDDIEALRQLNSNFDKKQETSRNISLENILAYVKSNKGIKAYWVEICTQKK